MFLSYERNQSIEVETHTNTQQVLCVLRPEVSSCLLPLNIYNIYTKCIIELQFRDYFACMREEVFFGWMGREHFFMMQYAMLITLHIPKWKNCFFKKKGPNTIDYTECIFLRYI